MFFIGKQACFTYFDTGFLLLERNGWTGGSPFPADFIGKDKIPPEGQRRGRIVRTGAKIYVGAVSLAGISLGVYSVWRYFFVDKTPFAGQDAFTQFLVLAVITVVCRCLPLTVREGCALDMSFISILSAVLIQGPVAAAAIVFITTPFVVVSVDGKKKNVPAYL